MTKNHYKKNTTCRVITQGTALSKDTGVELQREYEIAKKIVEQKVTVESVAGSKQTMLLVSDGSMVQGLGAIGPDAVLPILERMAVLLESKCTVASIPLPVYVRTFDALVQTVAGIAPAYGGVLLQGISSPQSFLFEKELQKHLSVPVFSVDQDGVALVVLAGLINAHEALKKNLKKSRVTILGAGGQCIALVKYLLLEGVGDVVVVDRDGILSPLRTNLSNEKEQIVSVTNRERRTGGVLEAVVGADVVIDTAFSTSLLVEHVQVMAQKPIVFLFGSDVHEDSVAHFYDAGAHVVATHSEVCPNHVHALHILSGFCKGVLAHGVKTVTDGMKLEVAHALAHTITPTHKKILPKLFDVRVAKNIENVFR
jgi:malate dehydrogenase (oxaloacetate-decarboxylating)